MGKVRIFKVLNNGNLEPMLGEGYETTADALKHLRVAGKPEEVYTTGLMGDKVRLEAKMICVKVADEKKERR